jgi:GcrA cell cycle regulator
MESIWTPELIQNLSKLWDEGHSTAEIGRRLGISKNAVVGKAHRLALTPRPSPLKRPPVRQPASGGAHAWAPGRAKDKNFG